MALPDPPDAWCLIDRGMASSGGHASSPWVLHCSAKPLLGLAAVSCEERGVCSLDQPVSDFIATEGPGLAATTLDALLRHEAGLVEPHGLAMTLIPQSRWPDIVARTEARGHRSYSDVVGWLLLAAILEAASGSSIFDLIRDVVPSHASNFLCRGQTPVTRCPPGIVIPIDMSGDGGVPLLGEVEWADEHPNPATGFVGSISSLAALLHDIGLSSTTGGTIASGVARRIVEASEPDFDERLGRVSSFGRGVLTDTFLHFDPGGTPLSGEWFSVASAGSGTLAAVRRGAHPRTLVMAWQTVFLSDEDRAAGRRRSVVDVLTRLNQFDE